RSPPAAWREPSAGRFGRGPPPGRGGAGRPVGSGRRAGPTGTGGLDCRQGSEAALFRRADHAPGRRSARPSPAQRRAELDVRPHLAAPRTRARRSVFFRSPKSLVKYIGRGWRHFVALSYRAILYRSRAMNARADKAKSIFLNAAEIVPPAERQAYLDAQCAGDSALRQEVDDLLGHLENVGSFLEAP